MPITLKWDNEEKTIIRIDFVGEFTWDDINAIAHEEQVLLDSVEHKADFIVDLEKVILPKDTLANFSKIVSTPIIMHPNAGLIVVIGTNRFVEAILNIFGSVYKQGEKIVTVASLEEAYKAIKEQQLRRLG